MKTPTLKRLLTLAAAGLAAVVGPPHARAAYLVNVTVRPGYTFANADEYQASFLITQAVSELCPALIWQLRNSAAGYRAPTT